jgi:hypothetical protein
MVHGAVAPHVQEENDMNSNDDAQRSTNLGNLAPGGGTAFGSSPAPSGLRFRVFIFLLCSIPLAPLVKHNLFQLSWYHPSVVLIRELLPECGREEMKKKFLRAPSRRLYFSMYVQVLDAGC